MDATLTDHEAAGGNRGLASAAAGVAVAPVLAALLEARWLPAAVAVVLAVSPRRATQ
jgi:hypothetical protein